MQHIVLLAKKEEAMQIIDMLEKEEGLKLGVIEDKKITLSGKDNSIIICTNAHKVQLNDAVVWLGKHYDVNKLDFSGEHNYILVNSQNTSQIKSLAKIKADVITVGLSAKDTISVTSCEDTHISASLQRTVVISKNHVVEPMEISYSNTKSYDLHCVLAYLGIKILLFG